MERITEQISLYDHLEQMSFGEILDGINREDQKVALAVKEAQAQIEALVSAAFLRMQEGGRLFYIGAGTSGRLGVLDASECPPTFGVPPGMVVGIIAGGDHALRNPVEFAEDHTTQGWDDLQQYRANNQDFVVGISASGTAPYVVSALLACNAHGIATGCVTSNPGSPMAQAANLPVEVVVGPEFLTGSSRMKSGTAQKMILNMITTSLMIRLGRVKGNRMVDMQLSNQKLIERGTQMVMDATGVEEESAKALLIKMGSVRKAIESLGK